MSIMLGNRYLMEGRYADALLQFEMALQQEHDAAEAYYKLGVAYLYLAQYSEAVTALQEAVSLAPEWAEPTRKLALAHLRLCKPNRAAALLDSLLTDHAEVKNSPVSFGYLHMAAVDDLLQRVAREDPADADWACLVLLYCIQGSLTKAMSICEQEPQLQAKQPAIAQLIAKLT